MIKDSSKAYFLSTHQLLDVQLDTRFLFIKIQMLLIVLFLLPIAGLRIYQQEYLIAIINIAVVATVLLLYYFAHQTNKQKHYVVFTYLVPCMYSLTSYFSMSISEGENFALIYFVCSVYFFALRPSIAIFSTLLFFLAFFSITNEHFSDYQNSKIIISYFLFALSVATLTIQMQINQNKLSNRARYDSLTKARNQKLLLEDARRFLQLKDANGYDQEIYMLMIGLDNMATSSDIDKNHALLAFKTCLDQQTGVKDLVYLFDADTFCVISENNESGVLSLAEKIQHCTDKFELPRLEKLQIAIAIKRLESKNEEPQDWIEAAKDALEQVQSQPRQAPFIC